MVLLPAALSLIEMIRIAALVITDSSILNCDDVCKSLLVNHIC